MIPVPGLFEKAIDAYDREGRHYAGIEAVIEAVCMEMQNALLAHQPSMEDMTRYREATGLPAEFAANRAMMLGAKFAMRALGNPEPMTVPQRNYSGGHIYQPDRETYSGAWTEGQV